MDQLKLPANEEEFMLAVRGLPHLKRNGFATQLARQHYHDPKLLILIKELLLTTPLSTRVPFPKKNESDPDEVDLEFPQSTASKRFVERELALTMAIALGESALPIFLDALTHPSTAGRSKVIDPVVNFASDDVLFDLYPRCVPSVQSELRASMIRAARDDLLHKLGFTTAPTKSLVELPVVAKLENSLRNAEEYKRGDIWAKASLDTIWPHHHLRNPKFINPDSPLDLTDKIFQLAEQFPPRRSPPSTSSPYQLASPIEKRCLSFLKKDLARTLSLISRFCYTSDLGQHRLSLPTTFMKGREPRRFWHTLPLDVQKSTVEPFIINLMEKDNGALLRSRQLQNAGFLSELRWPVVFNIANKAIDYLKGATDQDGERKNIVSFVLSALETLQLRLSAVARVSHKRGIQESMEKAASDILTEAVKRFLASLTRTEKSDESIVQSLRSIFVDPTIRIARQYQILARTLYSNVQGVFAMDQVSRSTLEDMVIVFLGALKLKTPIIFDIPDNGIVHPYSNLPSTQNDDIFQLIVNGWPPKNHLHMYSKVVKLLSQGQREYVWSLMNDVDYFIDALYSIKPNHYHSQNLALNALEYLAPSPASRHPIISAAISHPDSSGISLKLYALADITDKTIRSSLHQQTYTRLFDDRLNVYTALIEATLASKSVPVFIETMKFFIPRIKNEILPDISRLPYLSGQVADIVDLFKSASETEASQIATLYLNWEKQNNEAISAVPAISHHIDNIVTSCFAIFCGTPSNAFFQMALELLWVRYLNDHGLSKARDQYATIFPNNSFDRRDESEELEFRKFILSASDRDCTLGYCRIQDEVGYVNAMYQRHQKVFGQQSFESAPAYSSFIQAMLHCLGVRWSKVPLLVKYVDTQMNNIRAVAGTADSPADWTKDPIRDSVAFILRLRDLYSSSVVKENPPAWWREFRELRLFSSLAMQEVEVRRSECVDGAGSLDQHKLDALVEHLLQVHRTACYIPFVSLHIMEKRQDLLLDTYITDGSKGVFNNDAADDPVAPPDWDFVNASRFFPHQCEVFASVFQRIIHSDEFPLRTRVRATEKYTKLPTTTIHELAQLLKEDLSPRISEAILMFLPRLDEPAAGIQFLLAPVILDGDLARTAIYSVKRSLEHIPIASISDLLESTFTADGNIRPLRITVFKELVRIASEYIRHPQIQSLVTKLWNRKLHQDVRIALLQSILPMLDSPQQNLAWAIVEDILSREELLLDDTPFVLLAVVPEVIEECINDVRVPLILQSEVLQDMATVKIPAVHCERFVDFVLWPLTRVKCSSSVSASLDKKQKSALLRRLQSIRRDAYRVAFTQFLSAKNAHQLAERVAQDLRDFTGNEDAIHAEYPEQLNNEALFNYLVSCIGLCVARDDKCWPQLLGVIDELASNVAEMGNDPTPKGLRSMNRLKDLDLGNNFLFDRSDDVRQRVARDRMSILQPLQTRGILDLFAEVAYSRRFRLFASDAARASKQIGSDAEVNKEARQLLADIVRLSQSLQFDREEVIRRLTELLSTVKGLQIRTALCEDILAGDHSVAEAPWANMMKLVALQQTVECSIKYALQLDGFHKEIALQHPAFYENHWKEVENMIHNVMSKSLEKNSPLRATKAFEILIPSILERGNGRCEKQMLQNLADKYSYMFCVSAPDWIQKTIHSALVESKVEQALKSVTALFRAVAPMDHLASYPYCLFSEAIYSGDFLSLDLSKFSIGHQRIVSLTFPYFLGKDSSGGDMEDRSAKATVSGLQELYDSWKAKSGESFKKKSAVASAASYTPSSALQVVLGIYKVHPKLTIANPSLFLSCLCLSLSDAELYAHSSRLLDALQVALTPAREGDSGKKWGWVPPAELALSFARKLLTDLTEDVSEAVLDGDFAIGVIRSKEKGVELLSWWVKTFLRTSYESGPTASFVIAEGKDRLLEIYEELRVLSCRSTEGKVRRTALRLPKARDL